ncbi:MAG: 3-deoxy-7-phosphoheptulonate synthase [Acidobacteria bacterium]|nr:3-deoxy-7-phosphoheptulonate synthase [Acidobacteriota bacterium]
MICKLANYADAERIDTLRGRLRKEGVESYLVKFDESHLLITENPSDRAATLLAESALVTHQFRLGTPYQLTSRRYHPADTTIAFADVLIGGEYVHVIAGPCAIESEPIARELATLMQKSGLVFFRGGLFKPRTSPYSFQGLGESGLSILRELKNMGMLLVTEALDDRCLRLLADIVDVIQIGSRNMHNFSLLRAVGELGKPVLLKRGMAATLEEFLMAAEYIVISGNRNVILCERGIRTVSDHTRNTLDLSAIPFLKRETHLPVIVDPSHGTGRRELVPAMSRAAVAAGADGVMIEIHPQPSIAWSDGDQSMFPADLPTLLLDIDRIAAAIGRKLWKKSSKN